MNTLKETMLFAVENNDFNLLRECLEKQLDVKITQQPSYDVLKEAHMKEILKEMIEEEKYKFLRYYMEGFCSHSKCEKSNKEKSLRQQEMMKSYYATNSISHSK